MPKFLKHTVWILTFAFTLLTCSGCLSKTVGESTKTPTAVTLTTSPANVTYREMTEELYIGYLGVQRDFALIVDNLQYNYDNNKGGCQDNPEVGCASMFTQYIMNYGLSATKFTGTASDKHVLVYYTSATEFVNFGSGNEDGNWLSFLSPTNGLGEEYDDFNRSENVLKNTCATGTDAKMCSYARQMVSKGYSNEVGNAMMLFFHEGDYVDMVSDKMLDPTGKLDTAADHDNIVKDTSPTSPTYVNYYNNMIKMIKEKVSVSDTTANSSKKAVKREIVQITLISDLIDLIEGKGKYEDVRDYLLLITTNGFLNEKIGNNYKYATVEDAMSGKLSDEIDSLGGALTQALDNIMLLFNTASSFDDNCAYESNVFLNFLKSMLEHVVGALAGAAMGAGLGAAVGSIIPGVGTAIGAVVGGIIGAIAGWFATDKIAEMLNDKNGITGDKYCKIMIAALDDFDINVPVYSYNIGSFGDAVNGKGETEYGNMHKYRNGTLDPKLTQYYNQNKLKCLTQNVKVSVPSGLLSLIVADAGQQYNYADRCEIELVNQIVGGFGGSPSLLLFVNRQKADDLHGRATTSIIREMIFSWGLTQIGTLYNLAVSNTLTNLGVTIGSAQVVSNMKYCISDNPVPNCDDPLSQTRSVTGDNYNNGSYIATFDPSKGININFIEDYKSVSRQLTQEAINNIKDYEVGADQYYTKTPDSSWALTASIGGEGDNSGAILGDLVTRLGTNASQWYSVKHGDYYYIISNDAIVGYTSQSLDSGTQFVVEYYWDGTNQYIFSDDAISEAEANANYLTQSVMANPSSVTISGAHKDLYVYIEYNVTETNEDGEQVTKTNTYTYIL